MPSLARVRASNKTFSLPYSPVIVVFGGTSGIGRAIAARLAHLNQLHGRIHLVIVARNKVAAEKLFATLPTPTDGGSLSPQYTHEFLYCDLTSMTNIHATCTELSSRYPKINYLVLTSGRATFSWNRETTVDGIGSIIQLRFYWKFAVINDLLPSLRKAKELGEAASVLVVLGAGHGPKVDFTDLGVKRKHFGGAGPLVYGIPYSDLALALFAERNPDIAFTHMFCGWVATEANSPKATSLPWLKFILWLLQPLFRLIMISPSVSGENMVYGLLNGDRGFTQRNTSADSVGPRNVSYSEKDKQVFWEHCLKTTRSASQ
ncbi:hypothetical protein BKA70DRAFT_692085 [Coprinopsis sp. MPI-PUGE-AT-0042]|nr:hypothetical protein BKA70DRAFT_692085 [Coprinopsis sp. MPI-PUGE-AT-0042]